MKTKSIQEINEVYDLGLDKIVGQIKESRAKRVLLQFPDGMKPYAQVICDEVSGRSGAECFIWLGSCYGACDTPLGVEEKVDLVVQFGHTAWRY